jgi:hypothetical protein
MTGPEPNSERLIDLHDRPREIAKPVAQEPLGDVSGTCSFRGTGVHVRPSGMGFEDETELSPVNKDYRSSRLDDWMKHPVTSIVAAAIAAVFFWRILVWAMPELQNSLARGEYDDALFAALFPFVPWLIFFRFRRSVTTLWWDDDSLSGQGERFPWPAMIWRFPL